MAAQTLTAASNYDGPTLMLGLNNGEAITVNGGALTIDGDVRWGQNAAVHGSITVSATLGGSVLFEGRNVWQVPFTAASGNVPALAALGSNGVTGGTSGATGELFRVWGAGLEPLAAGGAMPTAGWIKLRSKTGTFSAGEVVNLPGGATITISSAGKRSWLHIVGSEGGTITIPRLGDVKWRGEWYEMGTTSGADDQTMQFPVADACPAMWVEKYAGSYAADGDAGLEPWLNAGGRWGTATQFVAQDERGKYFGQTLTTGVITIAQRASNACGFKPTAGLRVFVPNLILSNSTSANWSANTLNSTKTTRHETSTNQFGAVSMWGASCNWYLNSTNPVSVDVKRTAFGDFFDLTNCYGPSVIEDSAVGFALSSATLSYTAFLINAAYEGLTLRRFRAAKSVNGSIGTIQFADDVLLDDTQFDAFGNSGVVARNLGTNLLFSQCSRVTINNPKLVGTQLAFTMGSDAVVTDTLYADNVLGGTTVAAPVTAVSASSGWSGIKVAGFSSFADLPNVHPYTGFFSCGSNSGVLDIEVSDIGSPVAPYDCGSANAMATIASLRTFFGAVIRRVHVTNNRSALVDPGGTGMLVENVSGANAVSSSPSNSVIRSVRAAVNEPGASVGTHWVSSFNSDTSGEITVYCTEPTAKTVAQIATSFSAGSGFTGAGGVSMATVGDWWEATLPYFALGHTGLANTAPVIGGTNVANHALEFQADTGSGWSAWADLTGANLAAVGAINPAVGVKLKVRATVTTASASNLLAKIRIDTVTDAVSQRIQYPITAEYRLTLQNVVADSIVHVETATGTPVTTLTTSGGDVPLVLQAYEDGSPLNNLRIRVRKGSASPYYQPWETLTTAFPGSTSIFVSQISDE